MSVSTAGQLDIADNFFQIPHLPLPRSTFLDSEWRFSQHTTSKPLLLQTMTQKIIPFWFLFSISTVMMGLRLVGFVSAAALALLGVLSLDTSWTTATEWWSEGEVNVFLGVKSDNVWWDIDNLKIYFTKCPISLFRWKYRFVLSWKWELIVSSYRKNSALHKLASSSFLIRQK